MYQKFIVLLKISLTEFFIFVFTKKLFIYKYLIRHLIKYILAILIIYYLLI